MYATTTPAPSGSDSFRTLSLAALGGGALLLLLGGCGFLFYFAVPLVRVQNALLANTTLLSFVAVSAGFGGLLVVIGSALRDNTLKRGFTLPSPLLLLCAFFLILLIGQSVLALGFATAYFFPLWHVLAALLVPLAVLAYAVRRLDPVSFRSMLAQFTWGGLITIVLAIVLELVVGGLMVAGTLVGVTLLLGPSLLSQLGTALRANPPDLVSIRNVLMGQPFALVLLALAAFGLFVFIIPLLEETLKSAGPAALIAVRVRNAMLPTRSNALLWGMAAGAGYAFSENLFNAQGGLGNAQGVVGFWAGAMLLRAGTSLMHVLTTGTVAVGWYYALVEKRTPRLWLLFIAAATAHGLWNTGAVLLGGVSLFSAEGKLVTGLLGACILLLLLVLGAAGLLWLRALVRWGKGEAVWSGIGSAPNSTP